MVHMYKGVGVGGRFADFIYSFYLISHENELSWSH